MTTQEKLLEALFSPFPNESDTQIAKRCGLSIARFSNYKLGKRVMDVDAVIGCAQALGWDIRATVAQHEMETAATPRVKALWKNLAATATLLAVMVLGSAHAPAQAAPDGHNSGPKVCIMRNVRWWLNCARWWLSDRFRRAKPSPGNIEARLTA